MRLFVGVRIDPVVTSAAGALIEELRRRATRLAPGARITWIPEERLHLTVRFIGAADEARVEAIRLALDAPVEVPPFDLTLAGTGAFPPKGAPRVLWAGLIGGREGLLEIERAVSARLAAIGVPAEERPYNPHLTLARIRDAAGLKAAAVLDGLEDRVLGATRVEAITLFESRLSPTGPEYVPVQQTPLRRP